MMFISLARISGYANIFLYQIIFWIGEWGDAIAAAQRICEE